MSQLAEAILSCICCLSCHKISL